jgi:hypothetical protein
VALPRLAYGPALGAAIALAGAAPLFDIADPDERERLAAVLHDPSRLDAATLAHYEAMVINLNRQEDLLGPRTVLPTILAQRHLVGGLVAAAPDEIKARVLSVYAQLSRLVGWSLFNLGDYQNASYYYDDARTAAHDAQNVDLVTFVLCAMSHLHTWMGKPRVGIDHAVAAASWGPWAHGLPAPAHHEARENQARHRRGEPQRGRDGP